VSDASPDPEKGGVSAGWVVALVIALTLGLGGAFLIVAMSQPVELVETGTDATRADATHDGGPTAEKQGP